MALWYQIGHTYMQRKKWPYGSRIDTFKGTVSRDFLLLVSPQPQSIPLGLFRIFRKFVEIFASQGAPPVSTTPVLHLELRISPRIFEKIRNGPNGLIRGLGETDPCRKPEVENLVALSL